MRIKIIKPFEVWPERILKPSDEIFDIDDPIARRAIKSGSAIPVDQEDIEVYKHLEQKKVKTKNKKED